MGHFFSAGGWSGQVRGIVHDNSTSLRAASAGYGVQLSVKLSELCADPRPLGDKVFFHGPRKPTKKGARAAEEAAQWVMEQNQMEAAIGGSPVAPM